jgi:hypothetical protein
VKSLHNSQDNHVDDDPFEPVAEHEVNFQPLLAAASGRPYGLNKGDDPFDPVAENEVVDFRPLHHLQLASSGELAHRLHERGEEMEVRDLAAASTRLQIRPEYQHKTSGSQGPSLTFDSPPGDELRIQSSPIQVRKCNVTGVSRRTCNQESSLGEDM